MNSLIPFFDWLLTASLRASVLTLGVLFMQLLLQRYLSPRWRYALWLPVLVVLLMPVLPESPWSVQSVFTWEKTAQVVQVTTSITDAAPVQMPTKAGMPPPDAVKIDWPQLRVLIWAVGVALMLMVGGFSLMRTLARARQTCQSIGEELSSSLDVAAREVGLRQKPCLMISPHVTSPAVTGLLRPVMLLPPGFEENFTAEEKHLILKHELMHLKRGDLPLNTLLCVLLALHWFNPLLWLAFLKVRADREAACDAQVLQNATPQLRHAYGHALLKIESAFAPLRLSLGFIGMAQRHVSLRARIRSIAAPVQTRPLAGLAVAACMAAMTFLGVTRAAQDEDEPQIYLTAKFIEVAGAPNQPDSADKRIAEFLSDLPADKTSSKPLRMVLDDPQLATLVRKISKQKGVDLMATPSVTTRSGQKASIEVAREFKAPGQPPLEKKVGVMLDLLPTLGDAGSINLQLKPKIVEFDGFVDKGDGSQKPVFSERKAEDLMKLEPGQTALLDLSSRTDTQDVENIVDDKTKLSTDRFARRAIVLVTAQLIRPMKKPENASAAAAEKTTQPEKAVIGIHLGVMDQVDMKDANPDSAGMQVFSSGTKPLTLEGSKVVTYPRMAVRDGEETQVKSVVNTPVKDIAKPNGITYLPIGFIAKITPRLKGDRVSLNLDVTDSKIIGYEKKGGDDYPIARSWVYKAPVEVALGDTIVLWNEGEKRCYTVTPTLISATADAENALSRARGFRMLSYAFYKAHADDVLRYLEEDTQDTDPAKKGVRIVFPKSLEKELVSFKLKTTPDEVIQEIARQTGCTVRADAETVYLEKE